MNAPGVINVVIKERRNILVLAKTHAEKQDKRGDSTPKSHYKAKYP